MGGCSQRLNKKSKISPKAEVYQTCNVPNSRQSSSLSRKDREKGNMVGSPSRCEKEDSARSLDSVASNPFSKSYNPITVHWAQKQITDTFTSSSTKQKTTFFIHSSCTARPDSPAPSKGHNSRPEGPTGWNKNSRNT